MELKIIIDNKIEAEYLTSIALENSLSADQYATNIIVGWIQNHIKGIYVSSIRHLSTDELKIKLGPLADVKITGEKIMAWPTSNFPTSLDVIVDKADTTDDVVAADINGAYDCIEKLEAKVGVNGSAVATSHDKKIADLTTLLNTTIASLGWIQTTGTFTATPASTSTLTMTSDLTTIIRVGMTLKYVIGGVTKFGRVGAITSILLTVNGAPLSGNVTALYYGGGTVRQVVVIIPGLYEDASNTALIVSDLKSSLQWSLPVSYCVYFRVYSNTHDTHATHGQASVRINGTEVCTTAGGPTIAADATWYPTVVDIATAAYDVNPGEAIEITSIKGGNGNASDLTIEMIFITP